MVCFSLFYNLKFELFFFFYIDIERANQKGFWLCYEGTLYARGGEIDRQRTLTISRHSSSVYTCFNRIAGEIEKSIAACSRRSDSGAGPNRIESAEKKTKTKTKKQEDTKNIFSLSLFFSCSQYFSFAHYYLNACNRLRSSSIRLDMADIANFDRSSHRRQRSKTL